MNLAYENARHTNGRVHRQRLEMDQTYKAKIFHIAGELNTGADGLSRLPMFDETPALSQLPAFEEIPMKTREQVFAIDNLNPENSDHFPMNMLRMKIEQDKDEILQAKLSDSKYKDRFGKQKYDNVEVVTFNDLVWVPPALQAGIIEWYHENLYHPGSTRQINSIQVTFGWKGLRQQVDEYVRTCEQCQKMKITGKNKYGKLPLVPALRDKDPWEKVQVDCCGPWSIKTKLSDGKVLEYKIHLMSMIDLCTGFPEFSALANSTSKHAAETFDRVWLCRYPRPRQCGHDNGTEFMGSEFQEMCLSYDIESRPTTIKNPQAQGVVERMHLILGDALRTTVFEEDFSDDLDTLVQACAYSLRTTVPSNLPYSPSQLAFGCDMIFRHRVKIDWEMIKHKRSKQALANNTKENKKRVDHEYQVGDFAILLIPPYERSKQAKISSPTNGVYKILEINKNYGTVCLDYGGYSDWVSIRRIRPYHHRNA